MESLCESFKSISSILSGKQPLGPVKIAGWVRTKRGSKKVAFIQVNDGSNAQNIQIVCDATLENYSEIDRITTGVSVIVSGELVQSQGQGQAVEIIANNVEICGWADPEKYPIQKKEMTYEYLREISHLRARTALYSSIFRIRGKVAKMVHDFFEQEEFVEVHPPLMTSSDCEGGGEVFQATTLLRNSKSVINSEGKVDYPNDFFGKPVFLTVSGQLEAELMSFGLGKVYTFAPSFRAENSNTPRHLAEFWQIEPEMAFWNLADILSLGERLVQYVAKRYLAECSNDLDIIVKRNGVDPRADIEKVLSKGMVRISFYEAMELLAKSGKKFEFPVGPTCELQTEHEKYLCQYFDTLVGVYNYPEEQKSFYMYVNDDGKTVAGADILAPGIGELIGSSQREHRYDVLLKRMEHKGLNPDDYKGYLQTRQFGTVPHSGFGMGFERLLMWLTGMTNIRDVIPFPRTPNNCNQ